jgi:hypothetical protein
MLETKTLHVQEHIQALLFFPNNLLRICTVGGTVPTVTIDGGKQSNP